ncbi:uncharacterized protein B0I36DRAFT_30358 [Microdochium trichocladiopsis]|uniref:NmrA-like domain-containing protein n=1 Tax=Microdochium trichocladiopsis TaxID=1682393 RepID=A0A9P8XWI4_9PEZI|nr:uncharacterized protein B0I36DRAFT_30358 [Microdochium trichocladiopsis]KAH7021232.1 hypothetical protein B0I36DRAFT_30358 [Microdochium trichocladiopsis]
MATTTNSPSPTIAIIGASGKLGGATLHALLEHALHPPANIIALTSSKPGSETWDKLASTSSSSSGSPSIQVRHATFDDPQSLTAALDGVDVFFLVSTPRISMDFNDAPPGTGREAHHFAAIDAAVAAGVKVLVYSSLAFGFRSFAARRSHNVKDGASEGESKAGVMRAHLRTEAYLAELAAQGKLQSTVIREGLYNESWPLYLGYFDTKAYLEDKAGEEKGREEVVKLAGDGKISWTAIKDLGVGSAVVLSSLAAFLKSGNQGISDNRSNEFLGRKFYLSNPPSTALTLAEVANLITETATTAKATARKIKVQIVPLREHIATYTSRSGPESKPAVEWWARTYPALEDGECHVDDSTLAELLGRVGVKATPMEETVREMIIGRSP